MGTRAGQLATSRPRRLSLVNRTANVRLVNLMRPSLLIISAVHPFPGDSGQQQRVRNTLAAVRRNFSTTFVTVAAPDRVSTVRDQLTKLVDSPIVLSSRYHGLASKVVHRARGLLRTATTGLKFSNYLVELDLAPGRVREAVGNIRFDCVLFEYWHAVGCVSLFRDRGIPCVLDMHDVLWQAYARQLEGSPRLPRWWRSYALRQYTRREEAAWRQFTALVTINRSELEYVARQLGASVQRVHAPMGIDLLRWHRTWSPARPHRLAFYGGLGSSRNQEAARECLEEVLPRVRRVRPDTELWVIGSNPPPELRAWSDLPGVHVTGFLEDPRAVLSSATAVLCPWRGRFGFRSRIAEVMALGVPVIASADAVHGMELEPGRGLALADDPEAMAQAAIRWVEDEPLVRSQSALARAQIESRLGFEPTYGHLATQLERLARGQRCETHPERSVLAPTVNP